MSEVSGDDDVGPVLGFLCGLLRLEMFQLRRHDRSHHCQQSPKELGGTRGTGRCSRLSGNPVRVESWSRTEDTGRGYAFFLALHILYKDSRPHTVP